VFCQRCGSFSVKKHQGLPNGIYKYRCRDCGRIFSDLTGTIFEGTKIPLWKWLFALSEFIHTSGISSIELKGKISVNQKTAWRILTQIRKSLLAHNPLLKGVVEGDESYFGGKRKGNKGRSIRWSNKSCVVGVVERKGKAVIDVLNVVDEHSLTGFIENNVAEDSRVYTDAFGGYNGLSYAGYIHESINHNREFIRGDTHTQTIEGFWSLIKRKLRGVYYCPSATHLLLYLQEYVFRYNHRELSLREKFSSLLSFALKVI
jgi:transposase-like protein